MKYNITAAVYTSQKQEFVFFTFLVYPVGQMQTRPLTPLHEKEEKKKKSKKFILIQST